MMYLFYFFYSSGASKPNTNPNGDSKPMNSVLNAAQSAQRREGIYLVVHLNLDITNLNIVNFAM